MVLPSLKSRLHWPRLLPRIFVENHPYKFFVHHWVPDVQNEPLNWIEYV